MSEERKKLKKRKKHPKGRLTITNNVDECCQGLVQYDPGFPDRDRSIFAQFPFREFPRAVDCVYPDLPEVSSDESIYGSDSSPDDLEEFQDAESYENYDSDVLLDFYGDSTEDELEVGGERSEKSSEDNDDSAAFVDAKACATSGSVGLVGVQNTDNLSSTDLSESKIPDLPEVSSDDSIYGSPSSSDDSKEFQAAESYENYDSDVLSDFYGDSTEDELEVGGERRELSSEDNDDFAAFVDANACATSNPVCLVGVPKTDNLSSTDTTSNEDARKSSEDNESGMSSSSESSDENCQKSGNSTD